MVRNSTRRMGNDREHGTCPHLKMTFEQHAGSPSTPDIPKTNVPRPGAPLYQQQDPKIAVCGSSYTGYLHTL
jgi:hypothetical protein